MPDANRHLQDPLSLSLKEREAVPALSPLKVFAALLVAALSLAVLNSEALLNYLETRNPNRFTEYVYPYVEGWNTAMETAGITYISARLRETVQTLREWP